MQKLSRVSLAQFTVKMVMNSMTEDKPDQIHFADLKNNYYLIYSILLLMVSVSSRIFARYFFIK